MADKKTIDIVISTILQRTGIDAARKALSGLASHAKTFAANVGKNLMNVQAGFQMVGQAARTFIAAMSKGMEIERMTVQFKSLVGSMDLARQHMADLQELGRTPPFSTELFAEASKQMMKMSGGILGFKKDLEIVGDAAAATGNDIGQVGHAFGLAYQIIRDGQDFGRAGAQLVNLGLLTKQQVKDFDALSKSGATNKEIWDQLVETMGVYKGAMADTEKTTKGLVDAIQGEANQAMTDFSAAIAEEAKPALEDLLGWLKRINEDGTIEDWADRSVDALGKVSSVMGAVTEKIGDFLGITKRNSQGTLMAAMGGIGAGIVEGGEFGGGWRGFRKAQRAYIATHAKSSLVADAAAKKLSEMMAEDNEWAPGTDIRKFANDEDADQRQERAAQKSKRRAERHAKAEADAKKRIEDDLARAQEENDKRRAAKKAAEDEKAAKAADATAKANEKAIKKQEHDFGKYVSEVQKQFSKSQSAEGKQNTVIGRAQSEFEKAFAMYRAEDHGASTIAEERDYAKDYKQLQKDASRYGGKWRIDQLSALMAAGDTKGQADLLESWRKSSKFTPEVESMVRAAAADKTKTTAEDELRKISENTKGLGEKLDQLLSMKGGD